MDTQLTGLYACALTVIFIVLQYNVILQRAVSKISINYDGDLRLATKIRQHGNFIETVPLALILMLIAEITGASGVWLHAVGSLLLFGRIIHPFGLKAKFKIDPLRVIGTIATQLSMIISAIFIVWRIVG